MPHPGQGRPVNILNGHSAGPLVTKLTGTSAAPSRQNGTNVAGRNSAPTTRSTGNAERMRNACAWAGLSPDRVMPPALERTTPGHAELSAKAGRGFADRSELDRSEVD